MLFFVRKIVCMCMVAYNFGVSRSQSKKVAMFSPSLVEHPLFCFAINPMGYCSFLKNVFRTAAAAVTSVVSDSVRPHRHQPISVYKK